MDSCIGLIWWNMPLSIMIPPKHQKVKVVAIKMHKNASIWWDNLKRQHERDGKKNIQTYGKMKKGIKKEVPSL